MSRGLRLVGSTLTALGVLGSLAARPVDAQQNIEIKAAPPGEERLVKPEILPPPGAREITRPREADFYPENIRVRIDPAFIEPFTVLTQTSPKSAIRFGLAGWTSPNTPVSQGQGTYREIPGWFALGFALVWDVPVTPEGTAPAASPR
jgi:hypothetical protein